MSFDVCADPKLEKFLEAGRSFDQERPDDGFAIAYRQDFFTEGINRPESAKSEKAGAKIHSRLVDRLRDHATTIDGETLISLAAVGVKN